MERLILAIIAAVAVWLTMMLGIMVIHEDDCAAVGGEPTVKFNLEWGCVKKRERIEIPKPVRRMT